MGFSFHLEDRDEEAIVEFRKAIDLDPKSVSLSAFSILNELLEKKGRRDEAFALARKFVEQYPDDPDGHHRLGQLLVNDGQLMPAVDRTRTAEGKLRAVS
jgi:tetratricopeptide (TPR) repeat protein